jgi:tetratricopeptide (TPR) repeat protein
MKFYIEAGGFDGRARKVNNPQKDERYWKTVFDAVLRTEAKADVKEKAATYWSSRMGGEFLDTDWLRVMLFRVQGIHEKDSDAYVRRVAEQYKRKAPSVERVLQFCGYYSGRDLQKTRSEFFEKHGVPMVASLKAKEKIDLLNRLRLPLKMDDEVRALIPSVRTEGLKDEEIRDWAFFVAHYEGEDVVLRYIARMKDDLAAARARFDYYYSHSRRSRDYMEKALAQIPPLVKSPKHAQAVGWAKAELLHRLGQYEEAIRAYQAANRQPDSTWRITDCLVAMKQYGKAVETVRQLESVRGRLASEAALRVADIYRMSGNKGKEVQQLRTILRRYPKSGESSEAHQRLERYGVKIVGGEAEAEE